MIDPATDLRDAADAYMDGYGRAKFADLSPSAKRGMRLYWQAQLVESTGCTRQAAAKQVKRAIEGAPRPKRGAPYAGQPAKEQGK